MKIFDCTNYFNEDLIYGLRLEILDKYVDKFIVAESLYSHSGQRKKLNFDINKYPKFKSKIHYIVVENEPQDLIKLDGLPYEHAQGMKRMNSLKRIKQQYDVLREGIKDAKNDDLIILSDCDEIPNLENLNKVNSKQIIIFKQLLFYYKFDLHHNAMTWYGSKGCLKKDLLTFNWLRNIKNKTYNFWRIDTFFSKNKYMNVKIIENGGWHFTNIKSPEDIHMKLSNYGEHNEFEMSDIDLAKMSKLVKEKKVYFNHNLDKSNPNKYSYGHELVKINKNLLPKFLVDNYLKFKDWFEYKL
jgi:beta-1,4-mannosyl-glycoprotein beta-1,4-N-acetylglucosaminyltransferase|tara:strand:+ start:203 stop:1099 length:897 start_codon:yes stop_codon:yes gene_type:complete